MSPVWTWLIGLTVIAGLAAIVLAAFACCWTAKRMRDLAPKPPPIAPESEAVAIAAAASALLMKD